MEENLITVKEVLLHNNCPECYNNEGLKLTFKQKFVENKFYKSITKEIRQTLFCTKCKTDIYPVMWTDDIERVFEYQKKAFTPKPSAIKPKPLFWVLFIAFNVIIMLIILISVFPELFNL